jgi:hypothetical protein
VNKEADEEEPPRDIMPISDAVRHHLLSIPPLSLFLLTLVCWVC